MKKALIIGAAGFVGNYLIDHIQKSCIWSIVVTKMANEKILRNDIEVYDLDILNKSEIISLLAQIKPDYIFHLAAQSSVASSWKNPDLTVDVNIKGTLHVLDAIRNLDYKPRVLLIGSGEEYGHVKLDEVPILEDNVTRPGNIYAATKACQNMIGKIYSDAYKMDIMSVRAFNHIGPNQVPLFVVANFCKQVAEKMCIRDRLMAAADIGITDYSSWIYDFLLTRRPCFIYASDIELYNTQRGFYYPLETTPFPIAQNTLELCENIKKFDHSKYQFALEQFLSDKGCIEDGKAAERIADVIKNICTF